MRRSSFWIGPAIAVFGVAFGGTSAISGAEPAPVAEAVAPRPTSLWNFLGIPQGSDKLRDSSVNRLGNNPSRERVPPLKRIADPENLKAEKGNEDEEKGPIKTAAEVKGEADLAPQKIKAIKYLATMCCGCSKYRKDVKDAFLEALRDCTEEVRYEAAVALCQCAGNPCKVCNGSTCCDPDVMTRLHEMAEGKNPDGCDAESSPRVRAAASNALKACQDNFRPTGARPVPEQGPEGPIESRPGRPGGAASIPAGAGRIHLTGAAQFDGLQADAGDGGDSQSAASAGGLAMASDGGHTRRCIRPARSGKGAAPSEAPTAPTTEPGVGPEQPAVPGEPLTPEGVEPSALASTIGGVGGPRAVVPAMIGDFFAGGIYSATEGTGNVAIAGGDRLFKVAEDNSPLPTDRVFFNYNHFNNALQTIRGDMIDFNHYAFGLEKTFWDGDASLEMRIPFGGGLNANQSFDSGAPLTGAEFGNIPLVAKFLVYEGERHALAAGAAAVFPTARDVRLSNNGRTFLVMENDSVHLDPYVAWLWMPNDRWFTQTFFQFDFSANGNAVLRNFGNELTRTGVLQDQSLMLVDVKVGYWLYRDETARLLRGVAPTVELHHTTTLQNTDPVSGVENDFNRWDNLNLTAGLHFALGEFSTLTVFGVAPLKRDRASLGSTSSFDGEVGMQFVRRF